MPAPVALSQHEAEVTHRAITSAITFATSGDVAHHDSVPERIARVFALAQALECLGQPAQPMNTPAVPPRHAPTVADALRAYASWAEAAAADYAKGEVTGRAEVDVAAWWRREADAADRCRAALAAGDEEGIGTLPVHVPAYEAIADVVECILERVDDLETHPVGVELVRRARLAHTRLVPVD